MRFTSAPLGKLYVKLYTQKRPISEEIISYSIIGSDSKKFTVRTALCAKQFDTFPEFEVLELAIAELVRANNFETFEFLEK
jgi:hypothetical protein